MVPSIVRAASPVAAAAIQRGVRYMGELNSSGNLTPAIKSSIATRLGIPTFAFQQVAKIMSNNKFATALVLLELGELGMSIADELASVDADVRALLASNAVTVDDASKMTSENLLAYKDDLDVIAFAVARFGSFENYQKIKAALSMPKASDDLYLRIRALSRGIR